MSETVLRLFGHLELWHADRPLPLPPARPQALLTALALWRGQWCDTDRLVGTLWGEHPPPSALVNLRAFICQWRKLLTPQNTLSIDSRRGAYRLNPGDTVIDIAEFETLLADGDRALAAVDPGTAASRFEAALELWRGTPFSALGLCALAEQTRLTELRDRGRSGLVTALLAQDRHAEAVTVLRQAVAAQPYDERVWARLVSTLEVAGRRADALAAYRHIQGLLWEELGIAPGRELQAARLRVLAPTS
ncbi:AfsR/SARP family transcriptional regulator [Crossiella cryophila]|uniref:DNA-binding SARP family transcriptional activator n=1 Tax=Crossiella cryophila TaxID=43355 RepID=A0A7W7FWB8_9PSEU|nr:AfsR/SARP family transcriptional regulator [Crossiella cryophila]MBB4679895.1 DNA-binding SARP family transcriptional activator [Crossiella cryophila]